MASIRMYCTECGCFISDCECHNLQTRRNRERYLESCAHRQSQYAKSWKDRYMKMNKKYLEMRDRYLAEKKRKDNENSSSYATWMDSYLRSHLPGWLYWMVNKYV